MNEATIRNMTVDELFRFEIPITNQAQIETEIEDEAMRLIEWEFRAQEDSARRYGFCEAVCNLVDGMLDAMGLEDYDYDLGDLRREMEQMDYYPPERRPT